MSAKSLTNFLLHALIFCFFITGISSPLSAQRTKKKSSPKHMAVVTPVPPLITLTAEGQSLYRIVLPDHPNQHEEKAAQVLQSYLLQISGAALPILYSGQSISPYELVLGQNERLDELGLALDYQELGGDGFIIQNHERRLLLTGGNGKGTLYAVYTFLENYLGCRMYSSQVKIIPVDSSLTFDTIFDKQIPRIGFRSIHYRVTWDAEYADWHKLSQDAQGERTAWGLWVHTYNELLPPDVHFNQHPEYYAEVRGKRIPTQPCLSHPEVLTIITQNLRRKIAQNPSAKYWSVSQNDNRDYCTCTNCKAVDLQEGSPSGSIIRFTNAVAAQFPDKLISTLAYEYGRHAPKITHPAENVNIMLCSIEALRHKAITEDTASADFVQDVRDWGKIAKDIIIWDYVIQFPNLLSPFPNLHVLQPNLQFFAENGVNAMFEQGNREVGGELAELRAYLICKLMWNPYLNVDSLTQDFLNGFYGAGAPYLSTYLKEMTDALQKSGQSLRIFGNPIEAATSYLKPELLDRYEQLFDQAEQATKGDAAVHERVRIARLPLQFAIFEQAKKNYTGPRGIFEKINDRWEARTAIRQEIDDFIDLCNRQGVTRLKEWSTPPEEYRSAMYRLFSQGFKEHLAYGKPVTFLSPDPSKVNPTAAVTLTDGIRGNHDYAYNWWTFQGENLEAVIDLGAPTTVKRMESAYFQYAFWLRILPVRVEYYTSQDGQNFTLAGSVENTLPIDQYGGQQRDFISEFSPRPARYVKVKAITLGATPAWHPGGGRMAYMTVDEVVVE